MNSCVSPLIDNENYPAIMPKISDRKCLTMFFYCTSNLQLAPDIDNLCHTIFISLLYMVKLHCLTWPLEASEYTESDHQNKSLSNMWAYVGWNA